MMLSKDLQEILEGVHYFLSESLTGEPLSGKLECLRRGLVMQLEALALSYPTLRIRARSSASLPYLAMDGQIRSESMSSGSSGTNSYSNSYSNSSSGDGMVLGRGGGDTLDPRHQHQQQQIQDEEYEDFQENNKDDVASVNDTISLQDQTRDDADDREDVDDVYMESVEAVSFSNVIATCDKHGVLTKKTKGLLRNLKTYHCVASSGMLYLFLKETDERQRKTIDLSGYTARLATGEDIRDQRKRDSAFEIVGPGKKTHTFIARTPRDKVEWLAALDRTIRSGRRSQSSFALDTLISLEEPHRLSQPQLVAANSPLILPPKLGPQPLPEEKKDDPKPAEDDYYYHDVSADVKEEVYEEVGPEGLAGRVLAAGQSQTLPARTQPPPSWVMDPPDYDPVSPDDSPPPLPEGPPPLSSSARRPPGRPPLPAVLMDRVNKQASRPLPDAPSETTEAAEDPIGIYCEIEDDMLESGRESYEQRLAAENEKNWNLTSASNFNKPRAVSSEGVPSDLQSLSSRMSSNSLVGSLSDEIFMNISENSSTHALPHKFSLRSSTPKTPPKLPPKGIPYPQATDDDSEYKVPTSAIADTEYQIPSSNPVPTDTDNIRKRDSVGEISAPLPMQTYQVPPSQAIVPIKPKNNDRKNSIVEEETKPLTSFFSGKEDTNPKNNLKALTRRFEMKSESLPGEDARDEKRTPNQGTSVKDMIARINQNKSQVEKDTKSKIREEPVRPLSTSKSASAVFQVNPPPQEIAPPAADESRFAKPALPPRPHNLANGATIVVKPRTNEDTKSYDSTSRSTSDDDYYETPDDSSLESSSQRNSQDMAKVSDTSSGEYYIAKFAFVATIDQALSFNRGDTILVHDTASCTGWWRATLKGRTGLVPREYLRKKEQ
ncbi:uncharacterized protein LOC122250148 [Penaeus japonicus]|uniref:uncharacterized protein LOC122250148 n=1 Tax=Penaeus japonicus TaxID=27405 RepID=UPI001C70F6DC|nr:uncharacterized protein LOC122250148 [Penaeus japonicus]